MVCKEAAHQIILEDIRTGWIIGQGTERDGLYYVDEVVQSSTMMLAHETTEREAWLWNRRLGYPSFQKSVQIFRSDNGGEYVNSQMKLFFQSKGIVHQTTCPHTTEQNGVVERKNRLLLKMTRALIIESHVPKSFWPEALATATYLINRLPTKILKMKTPLETLSEYTTIPQPLTLQPKVFGCTVFAHIPKSYRDKLDPCAEKCVFVGYEYYYSPQYSGQGEEQGDPLKKTTRGAKYPMANIAKGNLSNNAKAFAIFTVKYKPDGTVERYKARLVAKGHTQTYGINYSETFSPLAKMDTIRVLLSVESNQGWPLHQFDVKNAFLHGELKEVYMEAPPEIKRLKEGLFTEFEMKDLGNLKYFLGIDVLRSPKEIFICQKKYILDLLAEIGMINCKPADTPMMVNQKLFMEKKAKLADRNRYQWLVEKLIYLSHTRPDIAYAVGVVSRFMHQPQVAHMNATLRIVGYFKGTAGHRVLFRSNGHLNIQMYTDADW
nr:putative reverse transcriptase, RNA-dependent DNA polymerase [Tanacetum cinerariifolium]